MADFSLDLSFFNTVDASFDSVSPDTATELFGSSFGASKGDFSCSHARVKGNLYATTKAILFYSNLLGFEKRITLRYRDIINMELYRTTSIRITLFDYDSYIFRSFKDRESVLRLLKKLKVASQRNDARVHSENNLLNASMPTPSLRRSTSANLSSSTPLRLNRKRSASDSLLSDQVNAETIQFMASPISKSEDTSLTEHEKDEEESLEDNSIESVAATWERVKQAGLPYANNVGIESLILHCSLHEFHSKFLQDNADYSLDWYQREHIGDRDIVITDWIAEGNDVFTRTMTFCHPVKSSFAMGPSEVRTTRQQRLRRFADIGLSLENTTTVEGIPSSDAFFVQDHWLVEANPSRRGEDPSAVILTTRFGCHFTKRALFRGVIEKSILKETSDWFAGYSKMLLKILEETPAAEATVEKGLVEAIPLEVRMFLERICISLDRVMLLAFFTLLLFGIVLILQILLMRETITEMREEFRLLHDMLNTLLKAQQTLERAGSSNG